MVERLDEGVGKLLDALDDAGLAKDTLVIFLNDNGGERLSDNGPLFHGKYTLWEGGIRVPCVLRWPGVAAGQDGLHPAGHRHGPDRLDPGRRRRRAARRRTPGRRGRVADPVRQEAAARAHLLLASAEAGRQISARRRCGAGSGSTSTTAKWSCSSTWRRTSARKRNLAFQHPEVVKELRTAWPNGRRNCLRSGADVRGNARWTAFRMPASRTPLDQFPGAGTA